MDACFDSRMIPLSMADSNRENTRQRAAQVYAGMTEGELRKLAEEAWSLTEIGKAYAGIFLGVPIPLSRRRWKCNSCGRIWPESDGGSE